MANDPKQADEKKIDELSKKFSKRMEKDEWGGVQSKTNKTPPQQNPTVSRKQIDAAHNEAIAEDERRRAAKAEEDEARARTTADRAQTRAANATLRTERDEDKLTKGKPSRGGFFSKLFYGLNDSVISPLNTLGNKVKDVNVSNVVMFFWIAVFIHVILECSVAVNFLDVSQAQVNVARLFVYFIYGLLFWLFVYDGQKAFSEIIQDNQLLYIVIALAVTGYFIPSIMQFTLPAHIPGMGTLFLTIPSLVFFVWLAIRARENQYIRAFFLVLIISYLSYAYGPILSSVFKLSGASYSAWLAYVPIWPLFILIAIPKPEKSKLNWILIFYIVALFLLLLSSKAWASNESFNAQGADASQGWWYILYSWKDRTTNMTTKFNSSNLDNAFGNYVEYATGETNNVENVKTDIVKFENAEILGAKEPLPGETVTFFADLKIGDDIDLDPNMDTTLLVACLPTNAVLKQPPKGTVLNIKDLRGGRENVECELKLKEGTNQINISASFEGTTESALPVYFMKKERKDRLDDPNDGYRDEKNAVSEFWRTYLTNKGINPSPKAVPSYATPVPVAVEVGYIMPLENGEKRSIPLIITFHNKGNGEITSFSDIKVSVPEGLTLTDCTGENGPGLVVAKIEQPIKNGVKKSFRCRLEVAETFDFVQEIKESMIIVSSRFNYQVTTTKSVSTKVTSTSGTSGSGSGTCSGFTPEKSNVPPSNYQTAYQNYDSLVDKYASSNTPTGLDKTSYKALIATIMEKESSVGLNNKNCPGKTYLTGCGWPPNCAKDCSCNSQSVFSDEGQIQCTAETLKKNYDSPQSPYDVCAKYSGDEKWHCIFQIYNKGDLSTPGGSEYADNALATWNKWKNYLCESASDDSTAGDYDDSPLDPTAGVVCTSGDPVPVDLVSTGQSCSGGCKLREPAAAAFSKAQQIAQSKGYTISLVSAYRSLDYQAQLFAANPNPALVAPPSATAPHVTGCAVDVHLYKNGAEVCTSSSGQAELESIMFEAGFIRYCGEHWHFEYGTRRWANGHKQGVKCT